MTVMHILSESSAFQGECLVDVGVVVALDI